MYSSIISIDSKGKFSFLNTGNNSFNNYQIYINASNINGIIGGNTHYIIDVSTFY